MPREVARISHDRRVAMHERWLVVESVHNISRKQVARIRTITFEESSARVHGRRQSSEPDADGKPLEGPHGRVADDAARFQPVLTDVCFDRLGPRPKRLYLREVLKPQLRSESQAVPQKI